MNFSFARLGVAAGILAFSSRCITDATVDLTKAPFNATTDVTDASTDATSRLTDGTSQGDRDRIFETRKVNMHTPTKRDNHDRRPFVV